MEFYLGLFRMYQEVTSLEGAEYLSEGNKRIFVVENARGRTTPTGKSDTSSLPFATGAHSEIKALQDYLLKLSSEPTKKLH